MTPVEALAEHPVGAESERELSADVAELTDPDSDALTFTSHAGGIWVTCTTDGGEVTVGPFPAGALQDALSALQTVVEC